MKSNIKMYCILSLKKGCLKGAHRPKFANLNVQFGLHNVSSKTNKQQQKKKNNQRNIIMFILLSFCEAKGLIKYVGHLVINYFS